MVTLPFTTPIAVPPVLLTDGAAGAAFAGNTPTNIAKALQQAIEAQSFLGRWLLPIIDTDVAVDCSDRLAATGRRYRLVWGRSLRLPVCLCSGRRLRILGRCRLTDARTGE